MRLFDSHCHYNDQRFELEFPGGREEAIRLSLASGVTKFLNCGTNPTTSRESLALCETHPQFYAAVGIHPEDSFTLNRDMDQQHLDEVRSMLDHPHAAAVGEIGLDYHYPDATDKPRQKFIFDAQLSLSEECGFPVVVHSRDAHGDTFDLIRAHRNAFGVMHSFSGSPEMARQYADLGWYISFSGPITYKNAEKVRECARSVPLDKILIETDAPYLPPVPHRGKINYSGYLLHTCIALSAAIGISEEHAAEITYQNACRLFRIHD